MEAVREFSLPKVKLWSALAEDQNAQEMLLLSAAVWDPKQVLNLSRTIRGTLAQGEETGDEPVSETPKSQAEFEQMLKANG